MSDLQRYIVEEWAEDYREGRLHRREFLRRTALMAGGTALALPVLRILGVAASADEVAEAAAGAPLLAVQLPGVTVPPDDPALEGGMIQFAAGSVSVQAYLARPKGQPPVPGVVVIHENRGLLEHFKDVARRLAKAGYVALAVDLASHEGGTARFADSPRSRPSWAALRPNSWWPCSTPECVSCKDCLQCAGTASARWVSAGHTHQRGDSGRT